MDNILHYPQSAIVNRVVPKTMFYKFMEVNPRMKTRFVNDVVNITWLYKLSAASLNVTNREDILFHPINTMYSWHFFKMLDVMSDNCQSPLTSSSTNDNIKIAYNKAFTDKALTYFCISANPILKWENGKSVFNHLRLFQMLIHSLAVKSTVCKFSNGYLGSKDLIRWRFCNVLIYSSTMVEKFNPGVSIKNIAFHNYLIIKVYVTVGQMVVIAVLHHLIILFAFCITPTTCQAEESRLALFCRHVQIYIYWHNQLVGQPLTITLRKVKPLQVCPKIVQCSCSHKSIVLFCKNT